MNQKLITFLIGLLGSAFGAGVAWGAMQNELGQKAEKAALAEFRQEQAVTHAQLEAKLDKRLERIENGVEVLRLVACKKDGHDSACQTPVRRPTGGP